MKHFGYLFFLGLVLGSCSRSIYHVMYPTLRDGKYDTEFPYWNGSKEIEEITRSVVRVLSITQYDDYLFLPSDSILASRITASTLKKAYKKRLSQNAVGGTATMLAYADRKVLLVTCAHLFKKPDTVFTYYRDERTGLPFYVQSVSIKRNQEVSSSDLREEGPMRILVREDAADVCLVVKEFVREPTFPIPVLRYPLGKSADLEWGSFVYLIGFPKGRQMITRGIVSGPSKRGTEPFLIDALFNRGFSGGLILGIRDGVPHFEIVGMATSSYSDNEEILTPDTTVPYDEQIPYTGPMYVRRRENINYGMSIAIPVESILKILSKHEDLLQREGFLLNEFLSRPRRRE